MPSAENIELSVAIDAKDTLTVLENINKGIKGVSNTAKEASDKAGEGGGIFKDLLNFEALKRGFDMVTDFFKDAVKEAQESVKVNAVWTQSIQRAGLSIQEARENVKKIAETNAFTEDDVKKIYNYGQALGISGEQLNKFVETTVDYSAATGKEMILSIRKVAGEALKGGEAFAEFSRNIKGAGADAADADGGLKRLNTTLKELAETAGTKLLVELTPLMYSLNQLLASANKDQTSNYEKQLKAINKQIDENKNKIIDYQRLVDKQSAFDKAFLTTDRDLKAAIHQTEQLEAQKSVIEGILGTKKKITAEDEKDLNVYETNYFDIVAYINKLKESLAQYGKVVDTTEKQKKALEEAQNQLQGIVQDVNGLLPIQDATVKQFDAAAKSVIGIFENVDKLTASLNEAQAAGEAFKLSTGDMVAIAEVLVGIFSAMVDMYRKMNEAEDPLVAQTQQILNIVTQYKLIVDQINDQISAANLAVGLASLAAGTNPNKEKVEAEIKAKQDLIDKNKLLMKANQDLIDASSKTNAGQSKQGIQNTIDFANKQVSEIQEQLKGNDNILGHLFGTYDSTKKALEQWQDLVKLEQAHLDLLNNAATAETDNLNLTLAQAQAEADIIKLKQEAKVIDDQNLIDTQALKQQLAELQGNQTDSVDAINQQLSALSDMLDNTDDLNDKLKIQIQMEQLKKQILTDQTGQLQTQSDLTSTIIDNMIKGGLIDVENISASNKIVGALSSAGYSQSQILGSVNQYGIKGNSSLTNQTFNIEVNEATGETLDSAVSGRLSKVFGGK